MKWTSNKLYLIRSFIVDLEMPDGERIYGVPRDKYPDLVAKAVAWRPNEHNPLMFQDDKAIRYVKDGEYYRDDGPALIWKDGTKFWYENARCWKIQRPDGTVELTNGERRVPLTPRPKRLSKDDALADLIDTIEFTGGEANSEIISRLTIAQARYFTDAIWHSFRNKCDKRLLEREEAWERDVFNLRYSP